MKYTVILEKGTSSYGAYVPDLPACIAVGETKEEACREADLFEIALINEAIQFHIQGLIKDGRAVPEPCSTSEVVVVRAA